MDRLEDCTQLARPKRKWHSQYNAGGEIARLVDGPDVGRDVVIGVDELEDCVTGRECGRRSLLKGAPKCSDVSMCDCVNGNIGGSKTTRALRRRKIRRRGRRIGGGWIVSALQALGAYLRRKQAIIGVLITESVVGDLPASCVCVTAPVARIKGLRVTKAW